MSTGPALSKGTLPSNIYFASPYGGGSTARKPVPRVRGEGSFMSFLPVWELSKTLPGPAPGWGRQNLEAAQSIDLGPL